VSADCYPAGVSTLPGEEPHDEPHEDARRPGPGEIACPTCQGAGRVEDAECWTCHGIGVVCAYCYDACIWRDDRDRPCDCCAAPGQWFADGLSASEALDGLAHLIGIGRSAYVYRDGDDFALADAADRRCGTLIASARPGMAGVVLRRSRQIAEALAIAPARHIADVIGNAAQVVSLTLELLGPAVTTQAQREALDAAVRAVARLAALRLAICEAADVADRVRP